MIYNGRDFSEFGVHVDESKAFGSPEKDYELIEVVGRNGNLSIYNDRFKDIVLSFPCFIRSGFIEKYRNLLAYLNSINGYQRLETEKEPNHFRKALFTGSVEVQTTPWNQGGFFTVNFSALPQRFLKSGDTTTSVSSSSSSVSGNPVSIDNPSGLTALTGLSVDIQPVQSGEGDPSPTNIRPITGHTQAVVQRTGKNLLLNNMTDGTTASVAYTRNADGSITCVGTPSNTSSTRSITRGIYHLANGEYILTGTGTVIKVRVNLIDENGTILSRIADNGSGANFTVDDTVHNISVLCYASSLTEVNETIYPMVRLASETDATYEPYTGNTYTINLNGTVYGGELDVSTGVLTVTHKFIEFDGSADEQWLFNTIFSSTQSRAYIAVSDIDTSVSDNSICDIISNKYVAKAYNRQSDVPRITGRYSVAQINVFIAPTTETDFKATLVAEPLQVVYKLATPQTVQLTAQQVSLLTGTNIISTDMESVTVTIASPAELENPTLFESKPIIRVYGNGTLNINDQYITVANSPYTYIDIDCELMDCYYGSNNANQYVSFSTTDYVTLRSGMNYFSYSGFTSVQVTPRWFEI